MLAAIFGQAEDEPDSPTTPPRPSENVQGVQVRKMSFKKAPVRESTVNDVDDATASVDLPSIICNLRKQHAIDLAAAAAETDRLREIVAAETIVHQHTRDVEVTLLSSELSAVDMDRVELHKLRASHKTLEADLTVLTRKNAALRLHVKELQRDVEAERQLREEQREAVLETHFFGPCSTKMQDGAQVQAEENTHVPVIEHRPTTGKDASIAGFGSVSLNHKHANAPAPFPVPPNAPNLRKLQSESSGAGPRTVNLTRTLSFTAKAGRKLRRSLSFT